MLRYTQKTYLNLFLSTFFLNALFQKKAVLKAYRILFLFFTALSFVCVSNSAISASLNARVDRTNISIDETLNLSITFSGDSKQTGPDLSQLESQFEILSRNQSSRVQYTNGSVVSSTEWSFTLGPKNTGKLLIPSFKIDGAFSDAVEVTVSKAVTSNVNSGKDLYIETFVNKDSVYVQEQIILTQRLYIAANMNVDQLDPEELILNNVVMEELPSSKYTKKIGQKTYYIFEYSSAIFPQSSTNIVIPSLLWNLRTAQRSRSSVFDRLGNYQIKRLRTQEKTIEVKPKPASYPASMPWLPAADIQLSQDWSKGTDTFKIGEPITRTITIEAKGLTSSQLPQFIEDTNSDGIKLYVDQPQLNDDQTDVGVIGRRIESAAIVVTRNGEVTIPATRIPWWNTTTDSLEYLELDAKTLFVKSTQINATGGASNTSGKQIQTSSTDTNNAENDLTNINSLKNNQGWKITAIVFLISTLILLIMYLRELLIRKNAAHVKTDSSNPEQKPKISEKKSWANLQASLNVEKYNESRNLLLIWSNSLEGRQDSSLQQINKRSSSEDLSAAITGIDALLYADEKTQNSLISQWNSKVILDHLIKYRDYRLRSQKNEKKGSSANLTPLHPTV